MTDQPLTIRDFLTWIVLDLLSWSFIGLVAVMLLIAWRGCP